MTIRSPSLTALGLMALLIAGCNRHDARYAALSQESLARQAEQNAAMARQSEQMAAIAKQAIEADAQARREVLELQRDLQQEVQTERASLDRQRETLEVERREHAESRRRESLLSSAMISSALIIAAVLPLILCGFLVWRLGPPDNAAVLNDLLLEELVADRPRLLPPSGTPRPARLLPPTEAPSDETAEN